MSILAERLRHTPQMSFEKQGSWVQIPQMLHFCINKPQLTNQEKKELIKIELRHFFIINKF